MTTERGQFTFYSSFAKAAERIKKKTDRCDFYDIVKDYALYGKLPELEKVADSVAVAFELIRPNLDASKRKADSGRAGGKAQANGKQTASKAQANGKRGETAREKEGEKEKEKEIEIEIENECSLSPTPLSTRRVPTFEEVCEYNRLRGSLIDPKPFFDYYDAASWRDSEGKPVYNWQQKFIAWEMREMEKQRVKNEKQQRGGNIFLEMLREEGGTDGTQ